MEITNEDRERAVESLKAAVRTGALSLDEFEERLQGVYAANSQDELELVLTLHGMQLDTPKRASGHSGRRRSAVLTLVVIAIAVVLGVVVVELQSRAHTLAKVDAVAPGKPSAGAPATSTVPPSPAARSLQVRIAPAGVFAQYDGANKCGPFGAPVTMDNGTTIMNFDNCYLVVQFTNTGSSPVSFIPAQLRMVDYDGNTYTTQSVTPSCYDSIDINAPRTLGPRRRLTFQICYPVQTGALPQKFTGFFTLAGVDAPIAPSAVVGTWGGT